MLQGQLTKWDDERGFGFITPEGGGDSVFLHIRALGNTPRRPHVGDTIHFEIEIQPDGRRRAQNARIEGVVVFQPLPASRRNNRQPSLAPAVFTIIVIGLIGSLVLKWQSRNSSSDTRSSTSASNYSSQVASSQRKEVAQKPAPISTTENPDDYIPKVQEPRPQRREKQVSSPPVPKEDIASSEREPMQEERDTSPPDGNEQRGLIKGNISIKDNTKWYHLPGTRDYNITKINTAKGERWFKTEEEAIAAGWTKAPGN